MTDKTSPATSVSDRAMSAVMAKDRGAWLDCFAEDALLRDPVGGSPLDPHGRGFRGHAALAQFWDSLVEPAQDVRFVVREEYPSPEATAKVASVAITLPGGEALTYDGVFVYEVDESGRIASLSGYFTPPFPAT
ncbi:nuclear transport factor 2 family protein [Salinispora arenicola]|uniref:nuclear transport factor 2 family protein n=1 Tax=Salinispora arenicola TaxID=168697 RepID=UPI00035D47D3|nr:nuclear transport factor 2 family protein [Salinispora arenicola]NIL57907.1 nuclear transport factor 2 family protein [Salinispora arenicola]NIL63972.1 nuclear transport factor 2 family protein [Salinispora arenicola]